MWLIIKYKYFDSIYLFNQKYRIMKHLLIIISMTITSLCFSQSGIVILTEQYTLSPPFSSTVHISMPNGTSNSTVITPENVSIAQHDIELNNLINNITNQGYQIITAPQGWGCYGCITNYGIRRIFFGVPWTSVVIDLTPSAEQTNVLSIYPNPAVSQISILIDNREIEGWSYYIVDVNGMVIFETDEFVIDISDLPSGKYILYAVKNQKYSFGIFIKQ